MKICTTENGMQKVYDDGTQIDTFEDCVEVEATERSAELRKKLRTETEAIAKRIFGKKRKRKSAVTDAERNTAATSAPMNAKSPRGK